MKEDYVKKVKNYFKINEEIDQKNLIKELEQKIFDSENTSKRKAIRDVEKTLYSLNSLENSLNYKDSENRKKYGGIGFLLGSLTSIPWSIYSALPKLPSKIYEDSGRSIEVISFPYVIGLWLICGAIGAALGFKFNDYKRKKHYQKAEKAVNNIEYIIKQYDEIKTTTEFEEIELKIRNIYKDFVFSKKKK